MIAEEGLPGLQWPTRPVHHVDRNSGLGDIHAGEPAQTSSGVFRPFLRHWRRLVESGKYRLRLDQNYQISLELMLLDYILPLLFRRGWVLVRAPEGSGGFITSDSPFYLTWSDPAKRKGDLAPGLAMNGTDIYFPVFRR
jgi:hypothetical protein